MSDFSAKYDPSKTEGKWYSYWLKHEFFKSVPDHREPYTIVIPPPNVTGILHMGHIMNNTIQDILIRRARMTGKNACWVPGTDHASIATEAKVVSKLAEEGIDKTSLSREEFLKHAWDWTHKHGGIILEQLKKMGASCDWDRTKFTLDDALYSSVIKVFVDLYNKGNIYRGVRPVNWDPKAKTAVSDEEVIYKELKSKLFYIKYKIKDTGDYLTVATTRPETILGDTAICVHPDDKRYKKFHGKHVFVPLIQREIPVITDSYVDIEFGTGALKVTPAHDENDYMLGLKHNLEIIDIFNDDGTLSNAAQIFIGKDRFDVKELIVPELEKAGNLLKIEDYTNKVGYSERTGVVIEPKLSTQWFLKMKDLAQPALENVMNDNVNFLPAKFKNTYKHWMENIRDWNISRQLWWGHRIPAYYLPNGRDFVVAENIDEALILAIQKTGNSKLTKDQLRQDEDVLDTWFSSWLWPISVFDGIRNPGNEDMKYYYPTNDLVTAPEIIFFWVARMIIAGYEYENQKPFKNVYFTGIVRDKQGRKMSKSLGNSPDALELIEKYGADGVRVGMMLCSPAGGDLLYDDSLPEQGRNFANKIWNAFRLVKGWEVNDAIAQPEHSKVGLEWFKHLLNQTVETLNKQFKDYRISEALMSSYRLFKDEFSSWLLEIVKPQYQQPIDKQTYNEIIALFEELLKLLHPFMPFITEEIWQELKPREEGESIMVQKLKIAEAYNDSLLEKFEQVKETVTQIRNIRKEKNISYKITLDLYKKAEINEIDDYFSEIIKKSAGIGTIKTVKEEVKGALHFVVKQTEYFVPMGESINVDEEINKLKTELKYAEGFLESVMKKLSNERFVNHAPVDVLEKEKAKQADAEAKISALKTQLINLGK
jgi:valyl-tRNA synthetase